MRTLHGNWFYVAVVTNGIAGLWGVTLAVLKRPADRWFTIAKWIAVGAMLVQVTLGFLTYAQGFRPTNDFHLFYGFVILFTFTFAYLYRAQFAKRPTLAWGLLLLFVMGLGLRAWANVH
jgi:predicted membrane channel-forming protein YqfA (hemolysin III family)